MINTSQLSIRKKAFILGVLPALLTLLIMSLYYLWKRIDDVKVQTELVSEILIEQLSSSIEYPVISGNYHLLEPLVASALKVNPIVSVEIQTGQKDRIYLATGNELNETSPEYDQGINVRYIIRPVYQEVDDISELDEFEDDDLDDEVHIPSVHTSTELIAHIVLGLDDDYLRKTAGNLFIQSLVIGGVVIVFFWFIATTLAKSMSKPLEELSKALKRITKKDYDVRMDITDSSEIGELQRNTNILVETLDKAERSNKRYTYQLIEERKKAELASKAKEEFLSIVSHELRTPINGALGAVQIISSSDGEEDVDELIHVADRSLNLLSAMVDDMLVLIDTDKKSSSLESKRISISETFQHLLPIYEEQASEKGLKFSLFLDDMLAKFPIYIDEKKFIQIVRHLIDNGIKFTSEGEISIAAFLESSGPSATLHIEVADTGIGIPEDKKQQLFNPFEQLDSSSVRQFDGAGLGLAVVLKTVEMMSGSFELKSNQPKGTVAVVDLPIHLDKEPPLSTKDIAGDKKKKLSDLNILLIDSDSYHLSIIEKILTRLNINYHSDIATLSYDDLLKENFDIVLLDFHLMNYISQDWLKFIYKSKSQGLLPSLEVVALVQEDSFESRQGCADFGVHKLITKPAKQEELMQLLNRCIVS